MNIRVPMPHLNTDFVQPLTGASAGTKRWIGWLMCVLALYGCVAFSSLWREQQAVESCVERSGVYDYEAGRCRDDLEHGRGQPLRERSPWLSSSGRSALVLGSALAIVLLLSGAGRRVLSEERDE